MTKKVYRVLSLKASLLLLVSNPLKSLESGKNRVERHAPQQGQPSFFELTSLVLLVSKSLNTYQQRSGGASRSPSRSIVSYPLKRALFLQ